MIFSFVNPVGELLRSLMFADAVDHQYLCDGSFIFYIDGDNRTYRCIND